MANFLSFIFSIFLCLQNINLFGDCKSNHFLLDELIYNKCDKITEINRLPGEYGNFILESLSKNRESSKRYVSISLNSPNDDYLKTLSSSAEKKGINFSFWKINDSYIEIEQTDLLIINTIQNYQHIDFELNRFSKNVRKYICIPEMYKNGTPVQKEERYFKDYLEYPNATRSRGIGVWLAVKRFLSSHPEWMIISDPKKTDMLVLSRNNSNFLSKSFELAPEVDYYIKNKIILCTGPSLGRYQMLKDHIESEMRLIPYKKVFVRTNDDKILGINFSNLKPECKRIPCIEKYVDCWNCIIASLQDAVNDPEVCDDDIILFKHETVFLNDLSLFKRAIDKILSGADMIARIFFAGATSDIFMVRVSGIKELIQNFSILPQLPENDYVESMFRSKIVNHIPNVFCINLGEAPFHPSNISHWGSNGYGFYHLHNYYKFSKSRNKAVDIFAQEFWNKDNYDELYQENHSTLTHKYYDSSSNFINDHQRLRPDLDTVELKTKR
jgi:hypothetical protein